MTRAFAGTLEAMTGALKQLTNEITDAAKKVKF
jgi:hypothetical protein